MKYRDNFKVRFVKKPEFVVDKATKSIKCYITCTVFVPTMLSDVLSMDNFQTFAKGYAKCDGNDKFNPEIGKKIALARAESKIYWKVNTLVKEIKKEAKKIVNAAKDFERKAYKLIGHNENYIDKYIYPIGKEEISRALSAKAKAQSRDELGRFTACTKTDAEKACSSKPCKDATRGIKIQINRK